MICYTYGVFDLLHQGHIESLREAKKHGDTLVVGVFTDRVAESFKRKPVIPQDQRMYMLKQIRGVDGVIFQEELSPLNNIMQVKAGVVAKGPGAMYEDMVLPIPKILLSYHPINSTTKIIEKCLLSQTI